MLIVDNFFLLWGSSNFRKACNLTSYVESGDDIIFSCGSNLRNGMLLYYLDGMNNWTNGLCVPNALISWFHTHKTNNYMFMKVLLSIIFQVLRGQIWQLVLVLHRWELKRLKDFASLFNKFTRNLYVYFSLNDTMFILFNFLFYVC